MTVAGVIDAANFTATGASVAGEPCFLALASEDTGTGAGKLTVTAPSAAGEFIAEVGLILVGATAGTSTKILLQPKKIIAVN